MKTNNLLSLVVLAMILVFSSCSDDDEITVSNIDGTWVNKNENTSNITKLIVSSESTIINVFGSCSPTDCDWGETALAPNGASSDYRASYTYPWASVSFVVSYIENDELKVITFTDFTEEDGRPDNGLTEYFVPN